MAELNRTGHVTVPWNREGPRLDDDTAALAAEHAADRKARDTDGLTPDELARRNVPEYGAGSAGELPRHREARLETSARVADATRAALDALKETWQDDPPSRTNFKQLLAALELYRPTLDRDATPFTLDRPTTKPRTPKTTDTDDLTAIRAKLNR